MDVLATMKSGLPSDAGPLFRTPASVKERRAKAWRILQQCCSLSAETGNGYRWCRYYVNWPRQCVSIQIAAGMVQSRKQARDIARRLEPYKGMIVYIYLDLSLFIHMYMVIYVSIIYICVCVCVRKHTAARREAPDHQNFFRED